MVPFLIIQLGKNAPPEQLMLAPKKGLSGAAAGHSSGRLGRETFTLAAGFQLEYCRLQEGSTGWP